MGDAVTAFAPGRVNLIGEHTDYNGGLALPFAIREGVRARATATDDRRVAVVARDLDAHDSFDLDDPRPVPGWRAFARGVAAELQRAGVALSGVHVQISGTVPRGSGLSSSAALEVALCLALLAVAGEPVPDPVTLARICSRVENDWVGAQTGLLDQLASLCGRRDTALAIDFATLEITPVPLDLGRWSLVTLDSGESHANAGDGPQDGYNQRRTECNQACAELKVDSLREVTAEMAGTLPWPLRGRAEHVIGENERVRETIAALDDGDLARVGELLDASHASLRDRFEISTPAVEATVARLRAGGAAGARLIGGGFGGHVLGLLGPDTPAPAGAQRVAPGPGAHLLDG